MTDTATKHTPGPWTVGQTHHNPYTQDVDVLRPDGLALAVAVHNWDITPSAALHNARLIAAAPDLLAALQDALSGWRYIRAQHGDLSGVGWDRVEQSARAAIAKATGAA